MATTLPGFYYWPNCLDETSIKRLEEYLAREDLPWQRVSKGNHSRRVLHFGYQYLYSTGEIKPTSPLPDLLKELAEIGFSYLQSITEKSVPTFNQALINEYLAEKAHGINWHRDHPAFGEFTIGSGCQIDFKRGEEMSWFYLKPASLYLISAETRSDWQHRIAPRKSDPHPNGRIKRGDRYSITFRSFSSYKYF